jgi:plastocyanin
MGSKPLNIIKKSWEGVWVAGALAVLSMAPVRAATLTIQVAANGIPLPEAVVTAISTRPSSAPVNRIRAKAVMVQQFQQFAPFVLPIQVGTTVEFPNRDPFRHHVYSFSPAKSFELKLYGGDRKEQVTFDRPGVVALGCNIHDNMLAYIYVVDTPYFATSGQDGGATLKDLPAGTYKVAVWHPDERAESPTQDVILSADTTEDLHLTVDLKRERRQHRPPPVDENGY